MNRNFLIGVILSLAYIIYELFVWCIFIICNERITLINFIIPIIFPIIWFLIMVNNNEKIIESLKKYRRIHNSYINSIIEKNTTLLERVKELEEENKILKLKKKRRIKKK